MIRLIFIFSIIPFMLNAQIKVSGFVELGHIDESFSINKYSRYVTDEIIAQTQDFASYRVEEKRESISFPGRNNLYSDIRLNLKYKVLNIEQTLYNIFNYDDGYSFNPIEIMYKTRVFIRVKGFDFGYEHLCSHPINVGYEHFKISRENAHDKFFIRLNFGNE